MVKNCNVLINNEAVTVIDYDGVQVQIPAIHRDTRTVKVVLENGRYTVVDDDYIEPVIETVAESTTKPKRKANNKKTTLDENAKNTEDVNIDEYLIDGE